MWLSKEKRAITLEEHQKIIAAEVNPERKTMYQLSWHFGASQGDIASLKDEERELGGAVRSPSRDGKPERGEMFRCLVYKISHQLQKSLLRLEASESVGGA